MVTENRPLKSVIRKEVLEKRKALSEEERRRAGILLADRIIGHQWFYRSKILLLFVSCGSEIDTTEILKEGLRTGKEVYVPKVEEQGMVFRRIYSLEDLSEGFRGIPEPPQDAPEFVYTEEDAEQVFMMMPGVAFDPRKNRIGYGKGYYDRYLASREALGLRTVAVGFRCQLVEEIPAEEHDLRPYQIILV